MKLTKHILDNISWWEHTTKLNGFDMELYDVFRIHFKQWWRPRLKIKIAQVVVEIHGDIYNYRRSSGAIDLIEQLHSIQ